LKTRSKKLEKGPDALGITSPKFQNLWPWEVGIWDLYLMLSLNPRVVLVLL